MSYCWEATRKVAWQDFLALRKIPWFNIASSFNVKFVGELGVDGGGPKREFFSGKVNIDHYFYFMENVHV